MSTLNQIQSGLAAAFGSRRVRALLLFTFTVIGIASVFYRWVEGWGVVDAVYFSVMTVATVGYGDLAPKTVLGKLFTIGYVLIGLGLFVATATAIAESMLKTTPGDPAPDASNDSALPESIARPESTAETAPAVNLRPALIAGGYGALAGVLAALTLWLMNVVSHLVWSVSDARWYIALAVMGGGVLIALIRRVTEDADLNAQLVQAHDPLHLKKRSTLFLALSAIVAVGFGGAVGPEAGLIAVVSEASALVALLIARSRSEARLIGDTGAVAALGGLYGASPGAAVYADPATEDSPTPLALKFLGVVAGFGGFLLTAHWLMPGTEMALPLPAYTPTRNGSELLWAVLPAVLGACAGVVFLWSHTRIAQALKRLGGPVLQTLVGSATFALMAAALPLLRFSGHHEVAHALEHGVHDGWPMLVGLGLLKALALALCLSSGWRGGEFFPLVFAGGATALAAVAWLPGTPPTVALVAGMGAATTLGMRKPVVALLAMLMLGGSSAPTALFVGVLVGHGVSRLLPRHS